MSRHVHIHLADYARQHGSLLKRRGKSGRVTLKPGRPSRKNELWYQSQLLAIVKQLRLSARRHLLPAIKADGRIEAKDSLSAAERSAFTAMSKDFGGISRTAERLANLAVQRNLESVDTQLVANIKSAIGVNVEGVLTNDGDIRQAVQEAVSANVALITSIPVEYFAKLEKALNENLVDGFRYDTIADYVEHVAGVTESRAKLIGRDQTSKMNSSFNEVRQTGLGIEKYTWQTSGDERVRETHAEQDGNVYSWDDPPSETGNPGEDIQCRCVAIPFFDLDAEEAALLGEEPDEE